MPFVRRSRRQRHGNIDDKTAGPRQPDGAARPSSRNFEDRACTSSHPLTEDRCPSSRPQFLSPLARQLHRQRPRDVVIRLCARRTRIPNQPPNDPRTRSRVGSGGQRSAASTCSLGARSCWCAGPRTGPFARIRTETSTVRRDQVERDLAAIAANGFNALRTYTVPPRWLLDAAERYGLRVMIGLPWEQHVAFLDDRARGDDIERRVRAAVQSCAGHPAVLSYAVGQRDPGADRAMARAPPGGAVPRAALRRGPQRGSDGPGDVRELSRPRSTSSCRSSTSCASTCTWSRRSAWQPTWRGSRTWSATAR